MADSTNPLRLASPPEATAGAADSPDKAASPSAEPTKPRKLKPAVDLSSPDFYLNRELTWLAFNWRVLREVEDETNPPLERLKFEAIVASNLDEFVMKRIGGLKQQVEAGIHELTVDGRTPQGQIEESYAVIRRLDKERRRLFDDLCGLLARNGVELCRYEDVSKAERDLLRGYYFDNIFPLVTPQAMDPAHPFPFISNLSLNLLVTVRDRRDRQASMARVKVPVGSGIPRWLRIANTGRFVRLEDVMAQNLDLLFPGMEVDTCELFRHGSTVAMPPLLYQQ
jgi:polyphosphate kinase